MLGPEGKAEPTEISGLKAFYVKDLAEELRGKGPGEFQQRYAHPFLLIVQTPPDDDSSLELKTEEASSAGLAQLAKEHNHQRVIPIVKSGRNALASKVTVGRARNNDIIIRANKISKLHSAFLLGPDGHRLADMGSVNGTIVNGVRIEGKQAVPLKDGDVISFWRYVFEFVQQDTMLTRLKNAT